MGTSAAYTPMPQWSGIMTDVTNALKPEVLEPERAHEIVSDFVQQLRDDSEAGFGEIPPDFGTLPPSDAADKLGGLLSNLPVLPSKAEWTSRPSAGSESGAGSGARGGGGAASPAGRTRGGGRVRVARTSGSSSVRPVAGRLASFISDVPRIGLRNALANAGVSIDGLPADKIAIAIVDVLAAESNLLIDAELRDALAVVMEEICDEAKTFEEAEQAFVESAYNLQDVIERLFECYIMERFKTFFSEHEAVKHGFDAADKVLNQARAYVASRLESERVERKDLTQVEWGGAEGATIIDAILENTISVFITE